MPTKTKQLEFICNLMQKLKPPFDLLVLQQIKNELKNLSHSVDSDLQQLSKIHNHLHPEMSEQHLQNFIVPIERLLSKQVDDGDFVIATTDSTKKNIPKKPIYFILHNLRSAFNTGSIFRLADCVGAKKIFLCGYTATPENPTVQKTSLNSHHYMEWELSDLELVITNLKAQNIFIYALETTSNAKNIFSTTLKTPCAFLVGNDRFGLEKAQIKLADEVLQIPMSGVKNSLNVANALSICAFEWSRQHEF